MALIRPLIRLRMTLHRSASDGSTELLYGQGTEYSVSYGVLRTYGLIALDPVLVPRPPSSTSTGNLDPKYLLQSFNPRQLPLCQYPRPFPQRPKRRAPNAFHPSIPIFGHRSFATLCHCLYVIFPLRAPCSLSSPLSAPEAFYR